ncbi:MAG: roadblock/LC7 domain-containing protein [Candidatus Eisenbacteria sp.]|nr:roadblock/LC7 domain-containing protein [Candidatus Eisenbacteria bacterium]
MVQLRWEGFGGDLERLQAQLDHLRQRAQGRAVFLMDSAGRLLTLVGDSPQFDVTTFVSLLAADFCATRELARLLGEEQFHSVSHQGEEHSLYLTQVTAGTILALVYDRETTLGLVRHAVRRALPGMGETIAAGLTWPKMGIQQLGDAFNEEALEQVEGLFDPRF